VLSWQGAIFAPCLFCVLMAAAETAARKAKRGLWADAKPIPPWDWRQSERERRQKSRSDVDTSYWLNTSSGVRDVCGGAASN
jgi:hypothetical protein